MIFYNNTRYHLKDNGDFCRAIKVYTLPDYIGTTVFMNCAFGDPTDKINDEFVGDVWEFISSEDNRPIAWFEENKKTGYIDVFAPINIAQEKLFDLLFYVSAKLVIK